MSHVAMGSIADRLRNKISTSVMIDQLIQYCEGRIDMQPARANCIIKLVGKILPDLQSVSIEASINHSALSRLELDAKLIALGHNPQDVWKSLDKPVIDHEVITIDQEPIEPVEDDV